MQKQNIDKETIERVCRKCGRSFNAKGYILQEVCDDCIDKLPRCFCCGAVLAPEYGYLETPSKLGKYDICGSCYEDIMTKGHINLTDGVRLMKDGMIIGADKAKKMFYGTRKKIKIEK